MKANKLMRTLAASAMSVALLAGVAVMPAMAAGGDVATITKNITKDQNAYAPKTDFTFTIAPAQDKDLTVGNNGLVIYKGVDGGVTFAEGAKTGTIASAPKTEDIGETSITAGTLGLEYHLDQFNAPGIYRYVVTETQGTYDGMTYSNETKYFDVYVTSNAEGTLSVASATFVSADNAATKDGGVFTNDYNNETDGGNKTLTVTKHVEGSMGDRNKEFAFNVTITGAEGEQYYVATTVNGETTYSTLTSGSATQISLADTDSFTIYGLSENDQYTISETSYTADGYTTKYLVNPVEGNTSDNATTGNAPATAAMGTAASTTINFYNIKNPSTPTGVIMNVAPYALMVVIAVAGVAVFMRKRVED